MHEMLEKINIQLQDHLRTKKNVLFGVAQYSHRAHSSGIRISMQWLKIAF